MRNVPNKALMKGILFCITTLFSFHLLNGQNLVPNGNFETYTSCPDSLSQIGKAFPWNTPTGGTSDYYNACFGDTCISFTSSGGGGGVCVPCNAQGCEEARSGNGYAGLIARTDSLPPPQDNYSEYIQTVLNEPLIQGQWYEVYFHASLADESNIAVELQTYLSKTPTFSSTPEFLTQYTPQINSNIPLTSKEGWTKVCGAFQAEGGEQYITIGVFKEKSEQQITTVTNRNPALFDSMSIDADIAYYYIDDVSVRATEIVANVPLQNDAYLCEEDSFITLRAATGMYEYAWQDSSTQDTLLVSDTGAYWVDLRYACQVTRQAFDVIGSIPNYNLIDSFCLGDTLTLDSLENTSYVWSTGQTGPQVIITSTETLYLTVTNPCETRIDTIQTLLVPIPTPDLGTDSFICFGDSIRIGDSIPGILSYVWQDGSRNVYFDVTKPDTYAVELSNKCISATFSKTFQNNCSCIPFIPNAFSPYQDEQNDVLRVIFNCTVQDFNFMLYDRFGQLVFQTQDPELAWDGSLNGTQVNAGTYVYMLSATIIEFGKEKIMHRSGNISLIR